MQILFLTHYFPPEGNAPASRVYEMCRRWVKTGHEVRVLTCAPNVPNGVVYKGYENRFKQTEFINGIEVIRVWTYIAANKGTVRRIMNYVSYMLVVVLVGLFVKRPDVVIATSPQFFCGWAGTLLSKLRRLPFILEIRDIWPESIVAVGAMKNKRLLRFLEWLELKMYASAKHIVTVGDGYRQKLLEKGVPNSRISIIMNGVDTEVLSPCKPDLRLKRQFGLEEKFVCSYIGTIGMACGLDVVVRAARILKDRNRDDIAFAIIGDGSVRAKLESQARDEKLDNIIFTGRQPKSLMPNFLSISDVCFVHLKKTDLFKTVMPSKIFEAAGMARPIVIGVEGFAAKLVLNAEAGVPVEPENEEQLVKVLETLANDQQLCQQYGRSGHDYMTSNYNRDDLAADYLDLISKLVSGNTKNVVLKN